MMKITDKNIFSYPAFLEQKILVIYKTEEYCQQWIDLLAIFFDVAETDLCENKYCSTLHVPLINFCFISYSESKELDWLQYNTIYYDPALNDEEVDILNKRFKNNRWPGLVRLPASHMTKIRYFVET